MSWCHKNWNHYISRRTANGTGWGGGGKGGGRCPGATGTIIIIQGGHFTAGPARGGKIDGDGDVLIPQQVEPF